MDNAVDTGTILEDVASGDAASLVGGWMKASWGMLSVEKILWTALLLAVCLVLVRLTMGLVRRLLERSSLEERTSRYVQRGLRALLYVLTALVTAGSLGVDVSSLIALVGVFGLAVSLAVQDVLSNLAGGMVLLFSKPFTLGDYVATEDGEGTVEEITLTHTKLDTADGQRVMLPNSRLVAGKIVNYSVRGIRRADLAVSASYGDSAGAVRASCLKALSRVPGILTDPPPQVVVASYGDSAVCYRVRFWSPAESFWDAHNAALEELRTCFGEDGITMTYNHLNVHLVDDKNTKEK